MTRLKIDIFIMKLNCLCFNVYPSDRNEKGVGVMKNNVS